jgi:predicted Rossmann fold flavoprotein
MSRKRLIITGGGAAGFFCAVNAAAMNPALEVMILEKTSKVLSKVKVSGGGRCNVTHSCFSISDMVNRYPRGGNFLKKTFRHFFTTDTINWFQEKGVELKTEKDGRMFPVTDSSQTIIDCLISEVNKYAIQILMNAEVKSIEKKDAGFNLVLADQRLYYTDYLCIASGGYPKAAMFDWLTNLGHHVEEPVPSLFTFNMPGNPIAALMGVSVEQVQVKIKGSKLEEQGPLLITHWGMSGPAILKLSAWGALEFQKKHYEFGILVNWLPAYNENTLREKFQQLRFQLAAQKIVNRNPFQLPQRLWEFLLTDSGIKEELRWADLPAREQNKLVKTICAGEFQVKGKTTFKEEFVTAGGIDLSEVDADTMMSKIVPGIFFAGEVLNIDGITGGYNFQNAWTTGYIAAKSISKKSLET